MRLQALGTLRAALECAQNPRELLSATDVSGQEAGTADTSLELTLSMVLDRLQDFTGAASAQFLVACGDKPVLVQSIVGGQGAYCEDDGRIPIAFGKYD